MKGGRLRTLGVISSTRSQMLPEVPAIAEAGLPGSEFDLWVYIAALAATPRAVIDVLHPAIARAVAAPDVRERLPMSAPNRDRARQRNWGGACWTRQSARRNS